MFTSRTRKSKLVRRIEAALGDRYTTSEIASMAGLGSIVEVDAGTQFIVEGTRGEDALLIVEGSAAVSRGDEVVAHVGVSDFVGECAVMTGAPRNASLVATSPIFALAFKRQEFAWLCLESNKVKAISRELVAARR